MNYMAPWHGWSIHVATLVHDYLALVHIRYQASLPWTFKPLKLGFLPSAGGTAFQVASAPDAWPLALAFGFFSLLAPLALAVLATLAVLAALLLF